MNAELSQLFTNILISYANNKVLTATESSEYFVHRIIKQLSTNKCKSSTVVCTIVLSHKLNQTQKTGFKPMLRQTSVLN